MRESGRRWKNRVDQEQNINYLGTKRDGEGAEREERERGRERERERERGREREGEMKRNLAFQLNFMMCIISIVQLRNCHSSQLFFLSVSLFTQTPISFYSFKVQHINLLQL